MYDYDFDYSLFEHKKSDTIKWVFTLVAFLIVGVMLAGILCGWFEKEEEIPQEEQQEQTYNGAPVTDENGEMIDGTESHLLPKAMAFRSAALLDGADAPYTSVTLTATVEPDTASDKTVDWSVRFMNGESEWAAGKNAEDYVLAVPQSDGATTAQVICQQPFGEQIVITVTSRENPDITAECTVDFVKRITDITVQLREGSTSGEVKASATGSEQLSISYEDTSKKYMTVEPQYTDGTMTDEYDYNVSFTVGQNIEILLYAVDYKCPGEEPKTTRDYVGLPSFSGGYSFFLDFTPRGYEDEDGVYHPAGSEPFNQFKTLLSKHYSDPLGSFSINMTGEYTSFDKSVEMIYTPGTVKISVENITLSQSGLVV